MRDCCIQNGSHTAFDDGPRQQLQQSGRRDRHILAGDPVWTIIGPNCGTESSYSQRAADAQFQFLLRRHSSCYWHCSTLVGHFSPPKPLSRAMFGLDSTVVTNLPTG
jgi:hypothetical protein